MASTTPPTPPLSTRHHGARMEDKALQVLRQAGLRMAARNFQCKMGEIDLIMWDGDTLVFVEVRYRQGHSHGSGIDSIIPAKQRKIIRAAKLYLLQQGLYDKVSCRFDVMGLSGDSAKPACEWIKNAFMAS